MYSYRIAIEENDSHTYNMSSCIVYSSLAHRSSPIIIYYIYIYIWGNISPQYKPGCMHAPGDVYRVYYAYTNNIRGCPAIFTYVVRKWQRKGLGRQHCEQRGWNGSVTSRLMTLSPPSMQKGSFYEEIKATDNMMEKRRALVDYFLTKDERCIERLDEIVQAKGGFEHLKLGVPSTPVPDRQKEQMEETYFGPNQFGISCDKPPPVQCVTQAGL